MVPANLSNSRSSTKRRSCRVAVVVLLLAVLVTVVYAQATDMVKRLERVAALIAENRNEAAEQELSAVLKEAPAEPAALNLLGTIRAKQGRLPEAESLFLHAIRVDKNYIGPHMNLAYLYTLMGQPGKTISELQAVLLLDSGNMQARDQLARLLLAEGRIDEGINVLELAGQAQLSASLLVLRGDAYLKKGNAAKAEESYHAALVRQGDETDAVLGLAQVAQLKGQVEAASTYLARARKMVANSPDTLYRFALVALRAGLFEEANGTLLAAIKLKPDDATYFFALGTTWIKKPDLVEAERAFRRALQLQPDIAQSQMYLGYTLL